MAYRSFGRLWQASTRLDTPPGSISHHPDSGIAQAAGHRDPSTTKLYDRRGYNPEKAASFFATY
jgi:hypothetical protein